MLLHYFILFYSFIHSPGDGHLGYFHVLAVVNSAAVHIGMHVSFGIRVFIFFQIYARNVIARLYNSSTSHFFKEPPYCFPQWLHPFTFTPIVQKNSLFSIPSLAFIFKLNLMIAIQTSKKWYLIVLLTL